MSNGSFVEFDLVANQSKLYSFPSTFQQDFTLYARTYNSNVTIGLLTLNCGSDTTTFGPVNGILYHDDIEGRFFDYNNIHPVYVLVTNSASANTTVQLGLNNDLSTAGSDNICSYVNGAMDCNDPDCTCDTGGGTNPDTYEQIFPPTCDECPEYSFENPYILTFGEENRI